MEILIPYETEKDASDALAKGKYGVVKRTIDQQPNEGVDVDKFDLNGVYESPLEALEAAKELNKTEGLREIQSPFGHPDVGPYEQADFVNKFEVGFTTGELSLRGSGVVVTPIENANQ